MTPAPPPDFDWNAVERRFRGEPTPPDWASAGGRDGFGTYADLTVGTVTQRLRWIRPGRFVMGSPSDEVGRFDREAPQHDVTVAKGFWLFDTPCPQALWVAVMGDNPSQFKDPAKPVETVSFNDVHEFLAKLNALAPDLCLTLPSEAQWEYACRAGTTTATYAGDFVPGEDGMRAVLDGIAWYGGNMVRNGPKPVAQKAPNQWGLYDMLGNVWEWCADTWHDNYGGAPADGTAWIGYDAAASRVMRSGSWGGVGRDLRAAFRVNADPALRSGDLGFRCARIQH